MICHFIFNGISTVLTWNNIRNGTKSQDITAMSKTVVISTLSVFFVMAACATVAIIYIILHLKKVNAKQGYEDKNVLLDKGNNISYKEIEYNKYEKVEKNSIISLIGAYSPLAISVALYVVYAL